MFIMEFVHLHVHSNYSFCRGANSIEQLCKAAKARGFAFLAITDTNGIYGLVWFLQTARSHGLGPLIGAFLKTDEHHAVILAKNINGYRFLCRTITKVHCEANFDLAQWIALQKHDVVVISDDAGLLRILEANKATDDVYVELIPHKNREALLAFARQAGLPVVATNAVYMVDKKDYATHKLLRAIDLNTTLNRLPQDEVESEQATLLNARDMQDFFPDCPEALQNSVKIAEQCFFELDFRRHIFPAYTGPDGEDANSILRRKVTRGLKWRYGEISSAIEKRLNYEMNIIIDKGFAPYFLIVSDIVSKAPRTCGRGSAAASLVSYALGITHVDPIKYDLFFERFLNPGRVDPPDIDVDFPWDERDDILDHIFKTYGHGRVAMIANHNSFKARSAVREIAKVYGLPESEIAAVTKKMGGYWQPESIWKLTQTHPIYRDTEFPHPWPEIIALAENIREYPRHLSIHCGGVVIAPDGIDSYVPYQPAKKALKLTGILDKNASGLPKNTKPEELRVIQWEKEQAEEMKLVKMDILGNRSLAVIRDALDAVNKNYRLYIDYAQWNPLEDEETQALLRAGNTIGVFYVESPAMRLLQQKTNKGDFEHLVIHSSIIRPAANTFINEYIRRLRGGEYEPLHPLLEDLLKETYGIMVYQEDVSKVVMALADFSAVEADDLRKILSKKHKQKRIADFREKFFAGALKKGVKRDAAEKIWDMILSFSGYSFCKPHSASYALVSFKSAYLKAHYPAEFIAAVISNQGGYYSTFAYISEARRMGLQVLMPDINHSEKEYVGKNGQIRVGLMQLKGLEKKTIDAILSQRRKGGRYRSLTDLLQRVKPELSDLSILVKSGCLDALEPQRTRPQLLWQARLFFANRPKAPVGATMSLFEEAGANEAPEIENYDDETILQHEIQTLGFLLSRHPLSLYEQKLKKQSFVKAKDLHLHAGKKVRTIGWFITGKVTSTRKKELMEFLSFEDTTAIYEATFFPRTFDKFVHIISRDRPYILQGRVDQQFGAVTLSVENVEYL